MHWLLFVAQTVSVDGKRREMKVVRDAYGPNNCYGVGLPSEELSGWGWNELIVMDAVSSLYEWGSEMKGCGGLIHHSG